MASNLLNTLKNIDSGRLKCIRGARANGVDIADDASLNELADRVFTDFDYAGNVMKPVPELDDLDTFETDPGIWHRPSTWPDLEAIFRSYDEVDGMYPKFAMLLDAADQTQTIFTANGNQYATGNNADTVFMGTSSYAYSPTFRGQFRVITSDGVTYDAALGASFSQTHIWDSTKDIVAEDGTRYRWFVVFGSYNTVTNVQKGNFGATSQTKILEIVTILNSWHQSAAIPAKLVRYATTRAWTPKQLEICQLAGSTTMSKYPNFNNTFKEYYLNSDDIHWYNDQRVYWRGNFICEHSAADVIIGTTNTSGYNLFDAIIARSPITVYMLFPVVGSSTSYIYDYPIKYLEGEINVAANYCNLSGLRKCKFKHPEKITIANYLTYNLSGAFKNIHYLDLSNLTDVGAYGIANNSADIIDLSSMTAITKASIFAYTSCKELRLPNLKSIGANQVLPEGLVELNLPELTTLTGTLTTSGSRYGGGPEIIRVPKLESLSAANAFANLFTLKWLDLPDGFSFALDLTNCHGLTHKCLVDILNKASGTTPNTITLPTTNTLGAEYKQIAIDKGWTVVN